MESSIAQDERASNAPDEGLWPDLRVVLEAPRPRIAPGLYEARSVDLKTFSVFRRRCLALYFDVYEGEAVGGRVIARVPMYFRLPRLDRPLRSSSKLARVFQLVNPSARRRDRLPLNVLRSKLWRVEVGDVAEGSERDERGHGRALHQAQRYSIVRAVLERLA